MNLLVPIRRIIYGMKRLRRVLPLVVALLAIATAIVVIEDPFGGGSAAGDAEGPLVSDASPAADGGQAGEQGPGGTTAVGGSPQDATASTSSQGQKAAETSQTQAFGDDASVARELVGIRAWINSQPSKISDHKGKVVLVEFWSYTCPFCIRSIPYLRDWHETYADSGLVILSVHTPQFSFEKDLENVREAVRQFEIGWAVAVDNDSATWRAYRNRYWPTFYLVDKDGRIRYKHIGSMAFDEAERTIGELLGERMAARP